MKRHGHLFAAAFTKEALIAAYHDAARSKRGKRACFTFEPCPADPLTAPSH